MNSFNEGLATLLISTCLKFQFVSALPEGLIRGRDCDSLFCLNPVDIFRPFEKLPNLSPFNWPDNSPALPPAEVPLAPDENLEAPKDRSLPTDRVLDSPPMIEPDITIQEILPSIDAQECQPMAPFSNANFQTDQGNANWRGCEKATQRLVFPLSCDDVSKNSVTEQIISKMDPKYNTLRDPACNIDDGVFFWLGWFTPEQVQSLQRDGAVRGIMTNMKALPEELTRTDPVGPISQQNQWLGLDKRASMSVSVRSTDDPTLEFISRGFKQADFPYYYTSFEAGGENVLAIVLTTALPVSLSTDIDPSRIVSRSERSRATTQSDVEDISPLLGSCTVQRIGGWDYGVSKNVKFALVEIERNIAQVLVTMQLLHSRIMRGQMVPPKNGMVMNFLACFEPVEPDQEEILEFVMEKVISELIADGIIFVASAGPGQASGGDAVVKAYPAKLSARLPIITVGSVNPFDGVVVGPRGPEVTVFAPNMGKCSSMSTQIYNGIDDTIVHGSVAGSSVAVATVTGLVAYFLSIPAIRLRFKQLGPPRSRRIISYLQLLSYSRGGGQKAVWNGLDNLDSTIWFKNGPGSPPTSITREN